ncbi:MAG: hypothetical protein ACHQAR_02460 [Steroidobacterales bacterium]
MVSKTKTPAGQSDAKEAGESVELSLERTVSQKLRGLTVRAKKVGVLGYNPYDAGPSAAPREAKKPTDLRKLSEWIRLQRQVEAAKKQKPEDE